MRNYYSILKEKDTPEILNEIYFELNIIAQNVKYYRKKRGLTQEVLANMSKISRRAVCTVENFRYEEKAVNVSTLIRIAKALNVKMWELMIITKK